MVCTEIWIICNRNPCSSSNIYTYYTFLFVWQLLMWLHLVKGDRTLLPVNTSCCLLIPQAQVWVRNILWYADNVEYFNTLFYSSAWRSKDMQDIPSHALTMMSWKLPGVDWKIISSHIFPQVFSSVSLEEKAAKYAFYILTNISRCHFFLHSQLQKSCFNCRTGNLNCEVCPRKC